MSFVCAHSGCGWHNATSEEIHKDACKRACIAAMGALRAGASAERAVEAAICMLEDDVSTNAGRGSCLNEQGEVECDAAIMCSEGRQFASVFAVSGVRNPISLAVTLLEHQRLGLRSGGREPAMSLAGSGARKYAEQHGLTIVDSTFFITERTRAAFQEHSRIVAADEARAKRARPESDASEKEATEGESPEYEAEAADDASTLRETLLDTVGVICMTADGRVAVGASSGGVALKSPGRVGQVPHFGTGVWVETSQDSVCACCTTGTGEQLIQTRLASTLPSRLLQSKSGLAVTLDNIVRDSFMESAFLRAEATRICGGLVLLGSRRDETTRRYSLELAAFHSGKSMAFASMHSEDVNPKARMLLNGRDAVGRCICVEITSIL
eukprot:m.48362 g.48362  ORF g.48362 m.48362 type:complete len:383 (-) comp14951_c0_seq2:173-1321(-)